MKNKITVIGAAIIDIMASGLSLNNDLSETRNLNEISLSFGGDALNESVLLRKLGVPVELISLVGEDQGGIQVINFLEKNNVDISKVIIEPELRTGINIVLVDNDGERFFLSDSNSSLRKLNKDHILNQLDNSGDYISFASLFVSPLLKIKDLDEIFSKLKKQDKFILADMTRAKLGEKAEDLKPILNKIDILLGNKDEFKVLTGSDDPEEIIKIFFKLGTKTLIVKMGKDGSVLGTDEKITNIPSYKVDNVIDTTGAGDSFAAGLLYGLINNFSILDSCLYASALSSCIVESLGASTGFKSKEEVNNRFNKLKTCFYSK